MQYIALHCTALNCTALHCTRIRLNHPFLIGFSVCCQLSVAMLIHIHSPAHSPAHSLTHPLAHAQVFAANLAAWLKESGVARCVVLCGLDAGLRRDAQIMGQAIRCVLEVEPSHSYGCGVGSMSLCAHV